MLGILRRAVGQWRVRALRKKMEARWDHLRSLGMHIGHRVALPASTWIDESFCYLISIGEECGFGEGCAILAHDAQMNEVLRATRVGRVIIHPSSHIGAGTIILPGVEIGPRTIVAAGSVVSRSLPPDTVCAGNPARAVSSLAEYLQIHRERSQKRPQFLLSEYRDAAALSPAQREALTRAVVDGDAYILTEPGYSERLKQAHDAQESRPRGGCSGCCARRACACTRPASADC